MAKTLLIVLAALAAATAVVVEVPDQTLEALSELDVQDDVCTDGTEECALSLRQLRGELKTVAGHDHARALSEAASQEKVKQTKEAAKGDDAVEQATSQEKAEQRKEAAKGNDAVKQVSNTTRQNASAASTQPAAASTQPAAASTQPAVVPAAAAVVTGNCTSEDQAAMARLGNGNARGTFPKTISDCGHRAYRWFSFHQGSMTSCIAKKVGISQSCAQCFGLSGQWGYDNCKFQCLFGSWCSHSCLGCTQPNNVQVKACAGVEIPSAEFC